MALKEKSISKPIISGQVPAVPAEDAPAPVRRGNIAGASLTSNIEQTPAPQDGKREFAPADTGAEIAGVIDLSVLRKIIGSDPVKLHKFYLKFLQSARQGLDEIDTALAQENMPALAALGHRHKSPAKTVGAFAFADLCQALEQFRHGGDIEQARNIVAQMRLLLELIAVRIQEQLT